MTDNDLQKQSPSYRLAALDEEFILGDSTRGVRFLLEYAKAEELLRKWGVISTIVVFGSARTKPAVEDDPRQASASTPSPDAMSRQLDRAARWYEQARRFGRIASERGGALLSRRAGRRNVIATGGGPGAMEAANRGAHDVGAPPIGFNINLPAEQFPNPYTTPELTFRFQYFGMRKMHMALRTNALVVFPGGFGTLDELFELITLQQTGKTARSPIVLFDEAYWKKLIDFDFLVDEGMIAAADLNLIAFAESAEQVWSLLVERGLRDHGPATHHR